MKKMQKLLVATVGLLGLAAGSAAITSHQAQAAANITIDGQFGDWQAYPATGVKYWDDGSGNAVSQIRLAVDQKMAYVYAEIHTNSNNEVPASVWDLTIGGKQVKLRVGNGSTTQGDVKVVLNNESAVVGSGKVIRTAANGNYNKDYSTVEFAFNLAQAGLTDVQPGATVTFNGGGTGLGNNPATTTVTAAANDGQATGNGVIVGETTKVQSDTNNTNNTNNSNDGTVHQNQSNDNLPIVIDGSYLDWEHITKTQTGGANDNDARYMAMVSDGRYLYIYAQTMPNQPMPGYSEYKFTIGGKKFAVRAKDMQSSRTTGAPAQAVTMTATDLQSWKNIGDVGNGYVKRISHVTDDQPTGFHDVFEYRIDLEKLGVSTFNGQDITMSNPEFGAGSVTVAGGSTGPLLLAGAGSLIAIFGVVKLRKQGRLGRLATRK